MASSADGISRLSSAFAESRWAVRQADAERRGRYGRLASTVVQTLDTKLTTLETALSRFSWPSDTPWSTDSNLALTRLLSPSGSDAPLSGYLSGTITAGDDAQRTYKYFSRGLDPNADAGLTEDITFTFTMTQGGTSKTISVDAQAGDDWGTILQATAQAVNDSVLAVQAEIIEQPVAYRAVPDLGKTGSILALSVDPGRTGQDVDLQNGWGNLLLRLDMEAARMPATAAGEARHSLVALSTAAPTTIVSDGFLPAQTTTLSAGEHTLAWTLGPHSGEVAVTIESGMDWEEVLGAMADAVNGSSDLLAAEVVETTVPTGLTDPFQPRAAQALALAVSAADPKRGHRLGLSDDDGVVAALGLDLTARPGSDALLRVDGTDRVSATGRVCADMGRLEMNVEQVFGEALPLSVIRAMGEIESAVLDVATAYNDLRSFLLANQDLLQPGLADTLRAPVSGNQGLEWLGVREMTSKDLLMVDQTRFWSALGSDSARARELLADSDGLMPGLEAAVAAIRSGDLADRLATPSLMADANAPWRSVFANETSQTLVDGLVDNATESGLAWKRVLELGGTLLDTIDAKRKA